MQCESCLSTMHAADSFCRMCGTPSGENPFSRRALQFLILAGNSMAGAMLLGASLCAHLGLIGEFSVYSVLSMTGTGVGWFAVRSLMRMEKPPRRIAPPFPSATTKRDFDTEAITKRLDD